nr:hypothetical protein [Lentzea flava]
MRGEGSPPYWGRLEDGYDTLLVPGLECLVLPRPRAGLAVDTASGHDWLPRA